MLFPFLWGVMLSFKNNHEIFSNPTGFPTSYDFSLFPETFKQGRILVLFKNSLTISVIVVIIQLSVLFLSSFAIARLHHKSKGMNDFFYYMFLAAMAIPQFVLIAQIYLLTLRIGEFAPLFGMNSLYSLVLPYTAGGISFSTLMYVGAMKGVPSEIEDAALIDGCRLPGIMFRITLPLVMPIVVTLIIFSFLGAWNEFVFASILLHSPSNFTLPLAMVFFKDQFSSDYGAMMRAVIVILIPQVIFYLIFQRRIIDGMATSGLKV